MAKRNIDKQKLKTEIKETRKALALAIEETGFVGHSEAELLADWDMFEQNKYSPYFDADWMFGVKGGFDIVIGNPPYGAYSGRYKFKLGYLYVKRHKDDLLLICANGDWTSVKVEKYAYTVIKNQTN